MSAARSVTPSVARSVARSIGLSFGLSVCQTFSQSMRLPACRLRDSAASHGTETDCRFVIVRSEFVVVVVDVHVYPGFEFQKHSYAYSRPSSTA